jgi:prepilin-type N-terminal cleavage/methylation domain-containing protein/prepilin-type processing-associated H-X9-DG protein
MSRWRFPSLSSVRAGNFAVSAGRFDMLRACRHVGRGRYRSTAAFTLIEVLVVLAVVGLLMSLLLPAVQASRESARTLRCAVNLRQFGQAIHAYHDAFGSLPPGRFPSYDPRYVGPNPPCTITVIDKSALLMLLPYLDQQQLYDRINQSTAIFGPENTTLFALRPGFFLCPSDGEAAELQSVGRNGLEPFLADPPGDRWRMALTNYSLCSGSVSVIAWPGVYRDCQVPPEAYAQSDGAFHDVAPMRLSNMVDGLTTTMFASEKPAGTLRHWLKLSEERPAQVGWWVSNNAGDTLFAAYPPPNFWLKDSRDLTALGVGAGSFHPGGVNVLMGDGSVRFIGDQIDSWDYTQARYGPGYFESLPFPGVWQALATRAGYESVSADF